jgi:hypothetical protein
MVQKNVGYKGQVGSSSSIWYDMVLVTKCPVYQS